MNKMHKFTFAFLAFSVGALCLAENNDESDSSSASKKEEQPSFVTKKNGNSLKNNDPKSQKRNFLTLLGEKLDSNKTNFSRTTEDDFEEAQKLFMRELSIGKTSLNEAFKEEVRKNNVGGIQAGLLLCDLVDADKKGRSLWAGTKKAFVYGGGVAMTCGIAGLVYLAEWVPSVDATNHALTKASLSQITWCLFTIVGGAASGVYGLLS